MSDLIHSKRLGDLLVIQLDRPRALNSLTLEMIEALARLLDRWEEAPDIRAFLVTGTGGRAFSAGGDIRTLSLGSRAAALQFWSEEYALIARIARLAKPWATMLDGIVMGGGVGLSVHAGPRIVTSRTQWSMPECQVGFFPDVGLTRVLARLPRGLGRFLALTGQSLEAADLLDFGLADGFVAEVDPGDPACVLNPANWRSPGRPPIFGPHLAVLDHAFAGPDLELALARFLRAPDPIFAEAQQRLRRSSPARLSLTWRLLNEAEADADLTITLSRELSAAGEVFDGKDFHEGVRARLIAKDDAPVWRDGYPVIDDAFFSIPKLGEP